MKQLAFVIFALGGIMLLIGRCVGCAAPAHSPVDRERYRFEMDDSIMLAHSCAEAKANVAEVQRRWLPTWPAAPLPVVPCESDGGRD